MYILRNIEHSIISEITILSYAYHEEIFKHVITHKQNKVDYKIKVITYTRV